MTYAVIRLGGRQFKVSEGEKFHLERQAGTKVDVLLYSDGNNVEIGQPILENIEVSLKKVEDKKAEKVEIGRYKSKSRYRKLKGHRQPITVFLVEKIGIKVKKENAKESDIKISAPGAAKGRPRKKKEA